MKNYRKPRKRKRNDLWTRDEFGSRLHV